MTNLQSSPTQKAARLRALRASLNLAVNEFADITDTAIKSIYNWENAKGKNGITEKGATKIAAALNNYSQDIALTTDWLLYGIGDSPKPISKVIHRTESTSANVPPNENITNEVERFLTCYQNSVSFTINDNLMVPAYKKGDIVCGINYSTLSSEDIYKDENCIIYSTKGVFVRNVHKIKDNLVIYKSFRNPDLLEDAKFFSIAIIVRHFSRLPTNETTSDSPD